MARTRQEYCRECGQKLSREHYLEQTPILAMMVPIMEGEMVSCLRLCRRPIPEQCRKKHPLLLIMVEAMVSNKRLHRRSRPKLKLKQSRERYREKLPQATATMLAVINHNNLLRHLQRVPPPPLMVQVVLNYRNSNQNQNQKRSRIEERRLM